MSSPTAARGSYRFFCVPCFNSSLLLGMVRPYARVTVSLKLQRDGKAIVLSLPLNTIHNSSEILDMMTELVSDDVGLRKVAGCLKFTLEFVKERKVEIKV